MEYGYGSADEYANVGTIMHARHVLWYRGVRGIIFTVLFSPRLPIMVAVKNKKAQTEQIK